MRRFVFRVIVLNGKLPSSILNFESWLLSGGTIFFCKPFNPPNFGSKQLIRWVLVTEKHQDIETWRVKSQNINITRDTFFRMSLGNLHNFIKANAIPGPDIPSHEKSICNLLNPVFISNNLLASVHFPHKTIVLIHDNPLLTRITNFGWILLLRMSEAHMTAGVCICVSFSSNYSDAYEGSKGSL